MYKILSIDGGGIKGVFPVSFLATIENTYQKKIYEHFDLIVGTSTGGIIAVGLGLGYSAYEILGFYKKYGLTIFHKLPIWSSLRHWFSHKYDNRPLKEALIATFGDKKLGDSKTRLVIPSATRETGEVYVYKTRHHTKFEKDSEVSVVDVAMATAAAPSFFPQFASSTSVPLVDGGVWANNPINVAVTEAIGVLNWSRDDIKILSIGCTSEVIDINVNAKRFVGKLFWAKKIIELIMSSQSSGACGAAQLLIGHRNVYRINPVVSKNRFKLDSSNCIPDLEGLGNSEARKSLPNLKHFFETKVEPFNPVV